MLDGLCRIVRIDATGKISTYAGASDDCGSSDGNASSARFNNLRGIAVDWAGNVFVCGTSATVRKVTPDGYVTTIAGQEAAPAYVDGPAAASRMQGPVALAIAPDGSLFVADGTAIRRIGAEGTVTTIVQGVSASSLAVDAAGGLYFTYSGISAIGYVTADRRILRVAGSDSTGTRAEFNTPVAITVDGRGVAYIADFMSSTIRRAEMITVVRRRATR